MTQQDIDRIDKIYQQKYGAAPTQAAPISGNSLSDEINKKLQEKEAQSKQQEQQNRGILGNLWEGVKETVTQPARALQQIGETIGTVGADEETKKKVHEFLQAGAKYNPAGLGEPIKNLEQGAGVVTQAAANLATPFAVTPLGMGIQGAVLGGGKAMEEEKGAGDVALAAGTQGVASAALGKIMQVGGGIVGKGVNAVKEELKPVFKKLAPYFTGVSKKELGIAFEQYPRITAEKLRILNDAATPEDAASLLKSDALSKVRSVVERAQKNAGNAFETGIQQIEKKFPDASGDISKIGRSILQKQERFGKPLTADAKTALKAVQEVVQQPRENTIGGMRTLLTDIWDIVEQSEQGSPAQRMALDVWKQTRQQLSDITNKEIDPIMNAYANFLEKKAALKPAWGSNVQEDTARNFVSQITGTSKTAAKDALIEMEKTAGVHGTAGSTIPELTINRLMKRLGVDQKITGSRLAELVVGAGILGGANAIGGAIGGEKGRGVAQLGGAALVTHALAPKVISDVLLSEVAPNATSAFRKKLGEIIQNPMTAQALFRLLRGASGEANPAETSDLKSQ